MEAHFRGVLDSSQGFQSSRQEALAGCRRYHPRLRFDRCSANEVVVVYWLLLKMRLIAVHRVAMSKLARLKQMVGEVMVRLGEDRATAQQVLLKVRHAALLRR